MNTHQEISQKIENLMQERYRDPTAFETFAVELMSLGVTRLTYDAMKDDMSFYKSDEFVHSLVRTDLTEDRKNSSWVLGTKLDVVKLEKAIEALDTGKMPATEFHREIFSAGVIFCYIY